MFAELPELRSNEVIPGVLQQRNLKKGMLRGPVGILHNMSRTDYAASFFGKIQQQEDKNENF